MEPDVQQLDAASAAGHTKRRRRGAELETALLRAAWSELAEAGFARLTMESVAARAQTGVAVLYRRWASKDELVIAAIRHYSAEHPVVIPNTGSLRDDLIELLGNVSEARIELAAVANASFAGLYDSAGLTPGEVRAILRGDAPNRGEDIFERADARGEIDISRMTLAVRELPLQLVRHDVLMTLRAIPPERILAIVDEIFWPLITALGILRR